MEILEDNWLFSDHSPPIFAKKNVTCSGEKTENAREAAERLQLAHNDTVQQLTEMNEKENQEQKKKMHRNWSAYITVAILITMIISVLVTVTVIKMCFL